MQRAIDLSHEKYCSVWHSLRQDITFKTHVQRGPGGMSASAGRRTYLDLLRGLAVLIMIEAHVIDSWTRLADRRSPRFGRSIDPRRLRGAAVPVSRGRAVALSASSKARRLGDEGKAAVAVGEARDSRSSAWRFSSASRPALSASRPPGRCSRSTSSTSWGRRSWSTAWLWGAARSGAAAGRVRRGTASSPSRRRSSARCHGWRSLPDVARRLHPTDPAAHQLRVLSRGRLLSSPARFSAC